MLHSKKYKVTIVENLIPQIRKILMEFKGPRINCCQQTSKLVVAELGVRVFQICL